MASSMIRLDQLCGRYRSERKRHPAEPPLDTAARVLALAGERLAATDVRYLVDWARSAFARDGIPPELRLSPRTVTLLERDELPAYPEPDRTVLLAAGLVECERRPTLDADLAAGRRTLRDLTRAEYDEVTEWLGDESGLSRGSFIFLGGWIPIGIVAIVAGIVVGFISGDWWLFLLTAIGGTILGYVAAIAAVITYSEVDGRWLRLGHSESAAWVIALSVGPAVALLVAVLVLNNA